MKCPNCDLPVTAAPWRYDDTDHGIHWVCPSDDALEPEFIYAPIGLAEALDNYLRELVENDIDVPAYLRYQQLTLIEEDEHVSLLRGA